MANHPLWQEDYWLVLMQLYLKKPVGVKAIYSRSMVDLALELNIEPEFLYEQMFRLRQHSTPSLQFLWDKFYTHQKKLNSYVEKLRLMKGFCNAKRFYHDVEIKETWQNDFKPLKDSLFEADILMPLHLIVILDLYFHLTPITMVFETPEIQELSKIMDVKSDTIVTVMETFQECDPYLNRMAFNVSPLYYQCHDIWQRFGDGNPQELSSKASQLKEYFKK